MKNMKQILARVVWVSNLGSWANVHPEMKSKVAGLIRRRLVVRDCDTERLTLTEQGERLLKERGIPTGAAGDTAAGTAKELVPDAVFWVDSWGQEIPE